MIFPYLMLAIISVFSSSVLSTEWLECDPPKSFSVELDNQNKLFVYDAEVNVKYNRNDLAVYDYPGLDEVNILINNTIISFSGFIVPESEEVNPNAFKTSKTFKSKIAGFARLKKENNVNTLTDYNLYLSRNHKEEELNIPKKVQVEIIHEAVACVKSTINQKIGIIRPEDMERARKHPYEFGSISVTSKYISNSHSQSSSSEDDTKEKMSADEIKLFLSNYSNTIPNNVEGGGIFQRIINKIVDLVVAKLVTKIREENQGKISIPDLNENFSTGSSWWQTTGDFNAFNGTFQDLTTLSRTKDVSLSHEGLKFIASSGFGLSLSNMKYRMYKLRYGIINVDGKLWASIDDVALTGRGSLDFSQRPCRAALDLRVSELGKIKVKITGLAPLNKLLSKLVTWVTKKWRDEIIVVVEDTLRDIIAKHLAGFDCEKFRPF